MQPVGIFTETRRTFGRVREHAKNFKSLIQKHNLTSIEAIKGVGNNPDVKSDLKEFWNEVSRAEGGKISGTLIMTIIGLGLGGVGIAAMGTAIGLPLAVLLAPAGFLIGQEYDEARSKSGHSTTQNSRISQDFTEGMFALTLSVGELQRDCENLRSQIASAIQTIENHKQAAEDVAQRVASIESALQGAMDKVARIDGLEQRLNKEASRLKLCLLTACIAMASCAATWIWMLAR